MIYWFKKYYFLIFLFTLGCKSPEVEKVSVETFFSTPQHFSYHISPNGKFLSFLQNYKGKLNVFVRSVNDTTSKQLTTFTDVSVKSCNWVGDNRLLCIKEKDSSGTSIGFLMDSDGSDVRFIRTKPKATLSLLDDFVSKDGNILIADNSRDEASFDVYQLNINTGNKTLFVKNQGNILTWFANKGEVILGLGGDGVNETLYYRKNLEEKFEPLISTNFKNTLEPLRFAKDKRYIYALSNLNRDKLALVVFDCFTGKEVKKIYEHPDADISEISISDLSGEPAYVTFEVDKREIHFLDAGYQKMYNSLRNKLPKQEIEIIDKDALEHHFLIKAYTDKNPGAYYIYNVRQKRLTKLAEVNPAIKPDQMCAMKPISYQAADGVTIHGYLTLPLGKKDKNLPCVILPHQGPSARNVWGYTPEVQFLANRGYAVLQMNFRGSTGYGKAFQTDGFKQWGTQMQDDIFDGTQWLIKQGIADPSKIGIFGYGFGGYSALNQVISHSTTYKCAASYSGYINLFTYIKGFPAYYRPYKLMINEIIGNPESDVNYLKKSSPIFRIDQIKVPILIAQGGKDPKVNVNETNQFVKELRKRDIAVNYILNENETQLFKDVNNKLTLYRQLEAFLGNYLKP